MNADVSGEGSVITAAGGTLTLTSGVGDDGVSTTNLYLSSGSSLVLTSSQGIGYTAPGGNSAPTLTFQGTGDLFQAINQGLANTISGSGIYIGTITGFSGTDLIKLASFNSTDFLIYSPSTNSITIEDSTGDVSNTFTFDSGTNIDAIELKQETITSASGSELIDVLTICFMPGTMIRTPKGEAAVETLRRGDPVLTFDGEVKPVVWVGRQTVVSRFADPVRNWPIRIAAGALAENVPSRDLLVSPEHALLVEDMLVNAGALVNGTSIRRESQVPDTFVYYHVELEDHALVLAENVPAETFIDNVDRRHFDNWAEHDALYPEGRAIAELPQPRAKAQRQLPAAIRQALAERATVLGLSEAA